MCRTAARLFANADPIPGPVVSAEVSGTQSNPITPVRDRDQRARASMRAVRGGSVASSGRT
jgi:hypothetical protein